MVGYSRAELLQLQGYDLDARAAPAETTARHRREDGRVFDVEISATYSGRGRRPAHLFLP